jgi:hypothetical protein
MRKKTWLVLTMGAALAGSPALADVWDIQTQSDNTAATENELVHGSDQMHDLEALAGPTADTDWYRISQKPYSSYEIVVDATSGDIGLTVVLERIGSDGTTVVQSSSSIGVGFSRSLRFTNATGVAVDTQYIRVKSGSCTTTCGPEDVYRLRAYETTYAVPRFNNSGSQSTVLLVQNPSSYTIAGNVYFWSVGGALLATQPFSVAAKGLFGLATASVVPGQSGTITVAHDGRYGDLAGKTVALEPATGFSFDSPMVPRPH